eukprot:TRINITY_DN1319_c0_g1_i2.p1 TRINITY_DN1319_c0_g1~~TRINITY_DN1319_c0_g1_i2.p1  ORF type:complete len:301 (+),score=54.72 TRINITY_DN1319_c0_g1_i2:113-1015(+)
MGACCENLCKGCPCCIACNRCCKTPEIPEYVNMEYVSMNEEDPSKPRIKVMSYNFLVYHHATINSFPWATGDMLWFDRRSKMILNEIRTSSPDILCCQEVDKHETYVKGLTALGYKVVYYPKPDGTGEGGIVAFKNDNFDLIEQHYLSMNDGTTNKDYQRNHIATICIIRNKQYDYILCVTNTHLFYLGSRDDIRTFQAAYLLHKLTEIKDRLGNIDGFIIGADLNAYPTSNCLKFLMSGESNAGNIYRGNNVETLKEIVKPYTNSLAFTSAYEQYHVMNAGGKWADGLTVDQRASRHLR